MKGTKEHHKIEATVRRLFNEKWRCNAEKKRRAIGNASPLHEFDLYDHGKLIGGISTSPWKNRTKSKTNNTGGQDRAAAELLWLDLWPDPERRVHVLTNYQMAAYTFERFRFGRFQHKITIYHCNRHTRTFTRIGTLKSKIKPQR